jgi:hypothetical protein
MRAVGLSTLQILACLAVAAAGLVPVFHKNKPFWGLYGMSFGDGPPHVHQVDDDSPAAAAGLRVGDVVLAVNGAPVDNAALSAALESLGPGEASRLRVKRGEAELDVTARGVEPPVALVYYPLVLHPVAGGVGLAAGLLVLATQPLRPAPLWRVALVLVAGLACAVVFFLAITHDSPFAYWKVRQYHNLNWGARLHFEQPWVGLVASLALAALAAWELRGSLAKGRPTQDPTNLPVRI